MTNNIKLIGVVGAGQMGLGIAQVFATSGFDVLLNDNNKIALSNSSEVIKANLKKAINKGRLHKDAGISSVKKIQLPKVSCNSCICIRLCLQSACRFFTCFVFKRRRRI